MNFHDLVPYQSLSDRHTMLWPDKKTLAIYFILNVEHSTLNEGYGHTFTQQQIASDLKNYSWREYGLRVGFWRLLKLFEHYDIPLSFLVNADILTEYPSITKVLQHNHILAHGKTNAEYPQDYTHIEEKKIIQGVADTFKQRIGYLPKGWLSPWLSIKPRTLDILHDVGFEYVLDLLMDDIPVKIQTPNKKHLWSLPYALETNDTPTVLARNYTSNQYYDSLISHLNACLELSIHNSMVMAIPLHTFVAGRPQYTSCLERFIQHLVSTEIKSKVWISHPDEILLNYNS